MYQVIIIEDDPMVASINKQYVELTPSFRVMPDGTVRQVYFYSVDVSEFAVNKLGDRGSLSAKSIVTNVQDFVVNVSKGLGLHP